MVYNGSNHLDFLEVNKVLVNQVYIVMRKYGVVEDFPTSTLSKDAARKNTRTQILSLIGYHDLSSDCTFDESYEEVEPDLPDFSGDKSSKKTCDKVGRKSIVANACPDIPCMTIMKQRSHFMECGQAIYPRHYMVINPYIKVLHIHRLTLK